MTTVTPEGFWLNFGARVLLHLSSFISIRNTMEIQGHVAAVTQSFCSRVPFRSESRARELLVESLVSICFFFGREPVSWNNVVHIFWPARMHVNTYNMFTRHVTHENGAYQKYKRVKSP